MLLPTVSIMYTYCMHKRKQPCVENVEMNVFMRIWFICQMRTSTQPRCNGDRRININTRLYSIQLSTIRTNNDLYEGVSTSK